MTSGDLEARIDRIESMQAIQQLPIHYAIAVDSRDFDAWTRLFIEDVDCGRHGKGRAVLKHFIEQACATFYRSMHQICGHRVDLESPDRATGQVYCRAEHESGDDWIVMAICYSDEYVRRDGQWYFVHRKERHWYAADQTRRPAGPDFFDWPGHTAVPPTMPGQWPSWAEFWNGPGKSHLHEVTRYPVVHK